MQTLYSFYKYNSSLFSALSLPEGIEQDTLIDYIMVNYGNCDVLGYFNPDILQSAIGNWSKRKNYEWEKLYATTQLEYDPISNYDRKETSTRTTNYSDNTESTNHNDVYAYNSDSPSPDSQNNTQGKLSHNGTDNYESTIKGNIGVTTSQQMLEAERGVAKFDIYEFIGEEFSSEFLVQLW